jgi:hypothetical protein
MSASAPASLHAPTLAEGLQVSDLLARHFLDRAALPADDMAAHLRAVSPPHPSLLAAHCFAIVAAANHHWKTPGQS